MEENRFDAEYWESRYTTGDHPWDVGRKSLPMETIITQLPNKNAKILIPGAGNGYEFDFLIHSGFENVTVLDWSPSALKRLHQAYPQMADSCFVCADFFLFKGQYDVILEQTFFCALDPVLRPKLVQQIHALLKPEGLYTGVLFDFPLTEEGPPFGGSTEEYLALFSPVLKINYLKPSLVSEPKRAGRELIFEFQKSNS